MNLLALWEYPGLQVLSYLMLSVSVAGAVRYLWRKVLPLFTRRTKTTLDEQIATYTASPIAIGALLFGLWRTAVHAQKVDLLTSAAQLENILLALEIATIFAVTLVCNGVFQGILHWYEAEIAPRTETQLDDDFLPLVRRLILLLLLFLATAMALGEMGKDITALVATASVASLAVALAAQDTLANMISGIMIMIDRPFRVGDRIEFRDGKIGDVLEVGIRSTRILSIDNHVLVVPNKDLANERIINHKVMDPRIRLVQRFSVAYSSDMEQVRRLVLDVVRRSAHIHHNPAPQVLLLEFADSGLQCELRCWVMHYSDYWTAKDEVNRAIKSAFEEHGISIPFPQQEVRVIGLPGSAALYSSTEAAAGKE